MNTTEKRGFWSERSKPIALGALLLLLLSFGFAMHEHVQRSGLENTMVVQRSEADALRIEKDGLKRRLESAGQELRKSHENALSLIAQRAEAEGKASDAQSRLEQNAADRANAIKWRKEAEALRTSNSGLQQQLGGLQASVDRLSMDNKALEASNATVRSEMEQMAANQARMDNSLVQAFRGKNERLTILAKRTRKLQISMELPTAMASSASYVITGPDGKVVKGDDPAVSVISSKLPGAALASGGAGAATGADQVKLVYNPKQRLKPGLYKVEVRSGEKKIGTTYIGLR